jgi:pentatricopeptide repeat protein
MDGGADWRGAPLSGQPAWSASAPTGLPISSSWHTGTGAVGYDGTPGVQASASWNAAISPHDGSLAQSLSHSQEEHHRLLANSALLASAPALRGGGFGAPSAFSAALASHAVAAAGHGGGAFAAAAPLQLPMQLQAPAPAPVVDVAYSVEDLLRFINGVPAGEEVAGVVVPALTHFDSSALAALMKELGRQGLSKRAVEIFDHLRTAAGPDLAHLLDIYTYTTAVSVCSASQQLQRALELVAEMRARGIPCNVHTYSALMNVCIKSNEVQLAHDVYQQMLAEGCLPNLVSRGAGRGGVLPPACLPARHLPPTCVRAPRPSGQSSPCQGALARRCPPGAALTAC